MPAPAPTQPPNRGDRRASLARTDHAGAARSKGGAGGGGGGSKHAPGPARHASLGAASKRLAERSAANRARGQDYPMQAIRIRAPDFP